MAHPLNSLNSCMFSPDSFSYVGTARVGRVGLRLTVEFKLGKERSEGKRELRDN